jgi:hypothetical protein
MMRFAARLAVNQLLSGIVIGQIFFQPGISHSPCELYQPKAETQEVTSKLCWKDVGLFLTFRHERIR